MNWRWCISKTYKTDIPEGSRFGRWTVIGVTPPVEAGKHRMALCECDCGNTKQVRKSSLVSGDSESCGCLAKELVSERTKTHGLSKHRLYEVWIGMNKRCTDDQRKDFKHYGGRGIRVEDEWQGPEGLVAFISDMMPSYVEGLEIDRVDVNGNYCKANCRWATRREQVINRRAFGYNFDTHFITFNGKTMCMSEWADELAIPAPMISDRISKLGWPVEKALTVAPKSRNSRVVVDGVSYDPKKIFKSYPNAFSTASKLGLTGYEYLTLIFSGVGYVEMNICKEWVRHKLPEALEGFDISTRKIPRMSDDFEPRHRVKFYE